MTDTGREVIMPEFTGVSEIAKYRKYSKEFKLQATKLVTEQGYSYNLAAKRLETTGWSVRNWVQKFQQTGELSSKTETQPKL
jgi:transposase-like protein